MSEKEDVHSVLDSGMGLSCGPSLNTTTGIEPSLDTASVTPRRQDGGQIGDYSSDAENPDLSFHLSPDVTNSGSPSPASRDQSGAATPPGRPMLNTSANSEGDNELSLNIETPTSAPRDLARETSQSSTRSRTTTDDSENGSVIDVPRPLNESKPSFGGFSGVVAGAVAAGVVTGGGVGGLVATAGLVAVGIAGLTYGATGAAAGSASASLTPGREEGSVQNRPQPLCESKPSLVRAVSSTADVSTADVSTAATGATAGYAPASTHATGLQRPQSYDERASTFPALGILEDELCTAGFYQDGNMYRCHSCPLFFNSKDSDIRRIETWKLHAQRSPECEFIKEIKGTNFIKECRSSSKVDAAEKQKSVKTSINAGAKDSDNPTQYITQNAEAHFPALFEQLHRLHESQEKQEEKEKESERKYKSLQEEVSENKKVCAKINREFYSLHGHICDMDTQMVARTDTLQQDLEQEKRQRERMGTHLQSSVVNAQRGENEIRGQMNAMQRKQMADHYELSEEQRALRDEMNERFSDQAGANNAVVTTQPPAPDMQSEPVTPVTFDVPRESDSDVDAEVTDVQPVPESDPGNR